MSSSFPIKQPHHPLSSGLIDDLILTFETAPFSLQKALGQLDILHHHFEQFEPDYTLSDIQFYWSSAESDESLALEEIDVFPFPFLIQLVRLFYFEGDSELVLNQKIFGLPREPRDVFEADLLVFMDALLQRGYDVNFKNTQGHTALHLAVIGQFHQVLPLLLKYQADVNVPDCYGETPLMDTLHAEDLIAFDLLLPHHPQLHLKNDNGSTLLHLAALKELVPAAEQLLLMGANPNTTDGRDQTALHIAVLGDHLEMVRLLLDHEADPRLMDSIGDTPLHLGAFNSLDMIQFLLSCGVDSGILNRNGQDIFCQTSHFYEPDVKAYLQELAKTINDRCALEETLEEIMTPYQSTDNTAPSPEISNTTKPKPLKRL